MRTSPTSLPVRRFVNLGFASALAVTSACSGGGDAGPVTPPTGGGPTVGAPASVQLAGGDGQTAVVGTRLGTPLAVRVLDARGAGVAGVAVQWTTQAGSVEPAASTTDATGTATATWTLGTTAGPMALTVTAAGREARFAATAMADRAATVVATSGVTGDSLVLGTWGETGTVAAQVLDRYGNAVNGLAISWSSSDTTVAKVSAAGQVTSGRAGVATLTMRADSARGTARVVVPVQRNAQCRVPGAVSPRGGARGPVTFAREATQRFPEHPMPYNGNDVAVLDYDRDGRQDLFLFNSVFAGPPGPAGRMFVFRNTGSAFADVTAQVIGPNPPVPGFSYRPIVADYNADGRPDLYVGQGGYDDQPFPGARNLLFLATAAGFVEVGATNLNPAPVGLTHGAAAADLDCDGDVDIVETDVRTPVREPSTRVQINNGAGMFTDRAAQLLPAAIMPTSNSAFLSFAACDLDRDGDADLVGGGWFVDQRRPDMLLINDGFGRFRAAPASATPTPTFGQSTYVIDIGCADFDGDGWNDLVLAANDNYRTGRTVFWRNNRDMTFSDVSQRVANEWPAARFPERTTVADFNGDGWPDVLTTGWGDPWNGWWSPTGSGGNAIWFNDGRGGFVRTPLENWWGMVWPIDVNGDGRLDLLWAGGMRTNNTPNQQIYLQR